PDRRSGAHRSSAHDKRPSCGGSPSSTPAADGVPPPPRHGPCIPGSPQVISSAIAGASRITIDVAAHSRSLDRHALAAPSRSGWAIETWAFPCSVDRGLRGAVHSLLICCRAHLTPGHMHEAPAPAQLESLRGFGYDAPMILAAGTMAGPFPSERRSHRTDR